MAIGNIASALFGPPQPLPTLTPESVKRKRLLAEALSKQGMDFSPIASPWQGAARLANALVGGLEERALDRAETEGMKSANEALRKALGASMGGDAAPVAAVPGGGAPAASGAMPRPPAFSTDLTGGINAATAKYNLDPGFLPRLAQIESNGDVNAKNPRSSAAGPFQFITSTARQYGLSNPYDPAQAADAAARLALDNKAVLARALGRDPSPGELYLAHQQGAGGAAKLLANPDARAADIVGMKAVTLNGGSPNMTAGQFASKWVNKFGGGVPQRPVQVASADPGFMPQMAYAPQPGQTAMSPAMTGIQTGLAQQFATTPPGVQPQERPAEPVQPSPGIPAMGGGGQSMQMPQEAQQPPPEAIKVAEVAAQPQVQRAAQAAAATPQGRAIVQQAQGAPMAAIMAALSNPWLGDGQKALLMMLVKDRLEKADPMRAMQMLELQQRIKKGEMELQEKPEYKVIGKDEFGNEQYGWVDPRSKTVTPVKPQAATPAAGGQGAVPTTPNGQPIPPVPPGVDPKKWREKWSEKAFEDARGPKGEEVTSLRKEVQNLPSYKNITQAAPIYKSMVDAAGRNSKASDLNLVYGLGKIMDPGSVVREGEMIMVKNAAGLPEWLLGTINALNGGAALTPETRKAIMQEAHGRVQSYKEAFDMDTRMYRGIVDRNKMNALDVIPDFGDFAPWSPAPPPRGQTFGFGAGGAPAPAAPPQQMDPNDPLGIRR